MIDLLLNYLSEIEEAILNNNEIDYLNSKCQWFHSDNLKESEIDFFLDRMRYYEKEFGDCDLMTDSIKKFYVLYDSIDNMIYSRKEFNFD